MWRHLVLALLLVAGLGLIYAQGMVGHVEINTSIETNNGTVIVGHQTGVHGPHGEANVMHTMTATASHPRASKMPAEFKKKFMERFREHLRKHLGLMVNLPERNILRETPRIERIAFRWNTVARRFHESLRETFLAYHRAFLSWLHYRKLYIKGEINDEVYLEKSKEFVETAITMTVKRLESIKEANLPEDNIGELIAQLKEVNTTVSEVNDLNTLRTLYREEIRPLLIAANEVIRAYYGVVDLMAMNGAVMKIDVSVQRIITALQRRGIELNKDKNVQAMLAHLNELKDRIMELREAYLSGKITGKEFLEELKKLRDEIQRTVMELRSLLRRVARMKVAVHVKATVRGGRR